MSNSARDAPVAAPDHREVPSLPRACAPRVLAPQRPPQRDVACLGAARQCPRPTRLTRPRLSAAGRRQRSRQQLRHRRPSWQLAPPSSRLQRRRCSAGRYAPDAAHMHVATAAWQTTAEQCEGGTLTRHSPRTGGARVTFSDSATTQQCDKPFTRRAAPALVLHVRTSRRALVKRHGVKRRVCWVSRQWMRAWACCRRPTGVCLPRRYASLGWVSRELLSALSRTQVWRAPCRLGWWRGTVCVCRTQQRVAAAPAQPARGGDAHWAPEPRHGARRGAHDCVCMPQCSMHAASG